MMFKPIKHVKVSDEIVDQIRNLISQGKLMPGDRLPPERELIREFDVSRPSLREALNALVTMGFLEVRGKRTFVKSVASESMENPISLIIKADTQKIFDLIEVRKAIETWGAFHAAERATEEDIKQLEKIIEEMRKAFEMGRSWEKQDADFHLGIAQATHNTIQTHVMCTIYELLRESMARMFRDRTKVKKLIDQHYKIFMAIKTHSPEKARERTLEHLNFVELEVKASTNQKK
ncbi:MAG: FadR family transcriptional regulator [Syntrophaceae bacterium]|nr:FadR family transcriptional regulator [Syntrophaceae bacterium]